jgi:hypothetical protein
MSAKLAKPGNVKDIRMSDLKDGQIAVVTDTYASGRIVQRFGDVGVAIGEDDGKSWSNIKVNTLSVRILEDGELIKIFNNK